MAASPQFTAVPRVAVIQLSAANPNLDGLGVMGAVTLAAGDNGSRIDKCVVKAAVTTTAGMVRLFLTSATATTLLSEIPIAATVKGATTPSFETVTDFLGGLVIPKGYAVKVSTEKAEAINVTLFGGDF
jgi:hypothetical protein